MISKCHFLVCNHCGLCIPSKKYSQSCQKNEQYWSNIDPKSLHGLGFSMLKDETETKKDRCLIENG